MSLQGEIEGNFGQGIWICGQWVVHGWIQECCEKVVENKEDTIKARYMAGKKNCPINIELAH